jgi:hypothetical protein
VIPLAAVGVAAWLLPPAGSPLLTRAAAAGAGVGAACLGAVLGQTIATPVVCFASALPIGAAAGGVAAGLQLCICSSVAVTAGGAGVAATLYGLEVAPRAAAQPDTPAGPWDETPGAQSMAY